jgi:hypothetical protein
MLVIGFPVQPFGNEMPNKVEIVGAISLILI